MRNRVIILLNFKISGRIAVFSAILSFILLGINYQKLVMPKIVFCLICSSLTTLGLIAYFAQIYWSFYFWSQFTLGARIGQVLKMS